MKTSIKIDFDENLSPVIAIEKRDSEDVRDKLVKAWAEKMGYESNVALVEYVSTLSDNGTLIHIKPIGTEELIKVRDNINTILERIKKQEDAV